MHIQHVSSIMLDNKLLEMGSKFRSGRCRSQCSRRLCSTSALHFLCVPYPPLHTCGHVYAYSGGAMDVLHLPDTSSTMVGQQATRSGIELPLLFRMCTQSRMLQAARLLFITVLHSCLVHSLHRNMYMHTKEVQLWSCTSWA